MIQTKLICRVLFLVTLLVAGGMTVDAAAQDDLPDGASTQDWVSSMPVSMNGEPDQSLPAGWTRNLWHDKFRAKGQRGLIYSNWKAENYFEDPLVVGLCEAIFDKDVARMERLIEKGADVNEVGEDGMTPLFWAFHVDDDPRPFGCLLKHGASPNVIANLKDRTEIQLVTPGSAVVHLVASGRYNRHFKNVFDNGGDPNLRWEIDHLELSTTPYLMTSPETPDAVERLRLLIRCGADVNERYKNGMTHASAFAVRGEELRCRLVLVELEEGADYRIFYSKNSLKAIGSAYDYGCHFRLIHFLAEAEPKVNERPVEEQTDYRAVVAWLENHGESFAQAKADLKRWDEWKKVGELGLIEKEHLERLASEAEKGHSNEKK